MQALILHVLLGGRSLLPVWSKVRVQKGGRNPKDRERKVLVKGAELPGELRCQAWCLPVPMKGRLRSCVLLMVGKGGKPFGKALTAA